MMKLILLVLLASCTTLASQNRSKEPLYFPADKNNIQVLPQRFEYDLMDNGKIQIGGIILDTTAMGFRIEEKKNGAFVLHLMWPSALMKKGEIALKNNFGKAVFSSKVMTLDNENADPNSLTTFSAPIGKEMVSSLKLYPFLNFCIYYEEGSSRFYLCSQDLFVTKNNEHKVLPLPKSPVTPQVDINGERVGKQGLVYFSSSVETISFRANNSLGAFLEIETRKNDIDFLDVIESKDKKSLQVRATGTDPFYQTKFIKLPDGSWQALISSERPTLYLNGDGGIPMRQELYIKGALPNAQLRGYLTVATAKKTYDSAIRTQGEVPPGVELSLEPNNAESKLEQQGQKFKWLIGSLKKNENTRSYLKAKFEDNTFTMSHDIFRGLPFAVSVGARAVAPSGTFFADFNFNWWFERLLWNQGRWANLHWGVGLEHSIYLPSDERKVDLTTAEILWRAKPGLHLIDATWGLTMPIRQYSMQDANLNSFGFGAYVLRPTTNFELKKMMSWYEMKFQYFTASSGDTVKLSYGWDAGVMAYKKISNRSYFKYGVRVNNMQLEPKPEEENMNFGLSLNLLYQF